MSLEYSLEIAEKVSVSEILTYLGSLPDFEHHGGGEIRTPELQAFVKEPSYLTSDVIEESFGFDPSVEVTFRLDKSYDRSAARYRVVWASSKLLRRTNGDVVLLFNGETVIFSRLGAHLTLNQIEGLWTPEMLSVIPRPYQIRSIPSI